MIKENLALIDGLRETIILGGRKDEECASVLRFLCQQHKGQIHTTYPPTSLLLDCVDRVEGLNLAALISVLLNQTYGHYANAGSLDPRVIAQQMLMTSAALIAHDPATCTALRSEKDITSLSYSMGLSLNQASNGVPAHFSIQHSLIAEPVVPNRRIPRQGSESTTAEFSSLGEWECKSPASTLQ